MKIFNASSYKDFFSSADTISDSEKIYFLAKALKDIEAVARISEGVEWYELIATEALKNAHE